MMICTKYCISLKKYDYDIHKDLINDEDSISNYLDRNEI